jgi:hypothetical protein
LHREPDSDGFARISIHVGGMEPLDLVADELFDCRNNLRQGVAVKGISRQRSLSEAREMA